MNQWTDSARTKLEQYFARVRQSLAASGADLDEVVEDLRRHVEEEIAARKLTVITEQDIENILARIGAPERTVAAAQGPKAPPAATRARRGFFQKLAAAGLLLFGVILPLGTTVFEFLTGACAGVLFDPIPTFGHAVLVLLVPLLNLAVWLAVLNPKETWRTRLGWANGFAIGVSLIYALLFLPPTPFALLGILFFGFGFIPLSPALSLLCALVLRKQLRCSGGDRRPLPGLWRGLALGVASLALLTLPMVITEMGLRMAASDSAAESTRGVDWLRAWGQDEELLRACYGRSGRGGQMYSWGKQLAPETARAIYYRVRGQPFNSVPPPKLYAARGRWNFMEEEFAWDNDQAGDAVAGRVRGLSLVSSRQDAVIEPDAALAYLEWTLEFKNDSRLQREARAQISLPPGAVVSRLTLWIDGEEREAAFGGRSQVKTAYKEVVERRRDPVLVTTCGPDRVLVQCFPVQPDGGRMKVRLGISAPLALPAADRAALRWPCFIERNFSMMDTFQHSLWAESTQPLETVGSKLKTEEGKPGVHALRGQLKDTELSAPANTLRARRQAESTLAWTRDTRESDHSLIRQTLVQKPVPQPARVILVVDGTRGMETFYRAIGAALSRLPADIDFAVLLARDGCEEIIPLQKGTADLYSRVALWKFHSVGGHDNVPALIRAWELAAEAKSSAIVWVHGPQPMLMDSAEELRQRFERSSNPPLLLDVQAVPGPNRILEKLDGLKPVRSVLRLGDLGDDLGQLFSLWNGKASSLECARERLAPASPEGNPQGVEASMHLTRLWAAGEVARLSASRRRDEAMELARRYQLVTPVSGAVVLETKAQYERAGLQPAPAESVPAVPEPSPFVLGLLGAGMLYLRFRRAS